MTLIPTCLFFRIFGALAALGLVASLVAQDRPNLPEGLSLGGGKAPAKPVDVEAPNAEAILLQLVTKAGGADEKAPRILVDRILGVGTIAMDATFQRDVEEASAAEAARILGLTLLRTPDKGLQEDGFRFLDRAIEGDSALAMELKAQILLDGAFGREKSVEEAIELLKRARQLPGATEAHRLLGDLALSGNGMPKDAAIALEYYRRGAEAGVISCLLTLHRLFREDGVVPKDPVEAERFGRVAADSGDPEAAFEMGMFYERFTGGEPQWLRAAEWLGKAAERGHVGAMLRLSDYRLEGRAGGVNSAEGIRLLRVAAGLGDGEAGFRIGEAYKSGVHLPQDPVSSTAWHRVAADRGHGLAENAYGLAVATGYGIAADPVTAVGWFKKAAGKGIPDAMINLGELNLLGVGVEKNAKEAMRWFEDAARAGSAIAAEKLAGLYASSDEPGLKDPLKAALWADRAVAGGRKEATALAESLRAALSPSQRAELESAAAAEVPPVEPQKERK